MSSRPPIPPDAKKRNGDNKAPNPIIHDDAATKVTGSGRVLRVEMADIEELSIDELEPVPALEEAEEASGSEPGEVGEYQPVDNRIFGRFELLIEMGRGGMATLFLARIQGPSNFEKLLAIKKIHDHLAHEEQFVRMFMDEARIAALIHHPNVATIFDMGRIDKSYFIAMEYVHGQNLTDILKAAVRDRSKFPWTHAARLVADAAAGLHSAHELKNQEGKALNVVHRDVSPQNLLVSYDGNVKVVDFGIAFAAEKLETTAVGTLKGKAGYMSPEQAMGEPLDRRSDVFSLGIVLWECVCVKRLFKEASEGATILKVREAVVPRPRSVRPDIPAELERIILKALAKDRSDRYDSAEDFAEDLEALLVTEGEVIRRQKIELMLENLFFDRKKLKDQQVKDALKWTGDNPIKGVGMGGSADTHSLVLGTGPQTVTVVKPWWPTAIIVGSIAAVAIVVLLVLKPFGAGSGKKQAPPAKAVAMSPMLPPPMRAKPLPTNVTLKVTVKPALASVEVTFQGKKYKGPLFQLLVPRSNKAETIQVSAPGYFPQTLVIVPNSDNDLPVSLMKAPKVKPPMRKRPMIRRWRPMRRRPMLKNIDWD